MEVESVACKSLSPQILEAPLDMSMVTGASCWLGRLSERIDCGGDFGRRTGSYGNTKIVTIRLKGLNPPQLKNRAAQLLLYA